MIRRVAMIASAAVLLVASTASAQQIPWNDRVFVNLSGGGGSSSQDITFSTQFPLFEETATVGATRQIKGGGFFDITAGAPVWGNFGAGVSFFKRSADSDGAVTASIPSPVRFDAPRSVTATLAGMKHRETWVAFLGIYTYPVSDKIDVMVLVGPAVVSATHDLATSASSSEGPSGPNVSVAVESIEKSFWGVQVGVDGRYLIMENVGVGMFLRFSSANGNVSDSVKLDFGGFQVGFGARLRF